MRNPQTRVLQFLTPIFLKLLNQKRDESSLLGNEKKLIRSIFLIQNESASPFQGNKFLNVFQYKFDMYIENDSQMTTSIEKITF